MTTTAAAAPPGVAARAEPDGDLEATASVRRATRSASGSRRRVVWAVLALLGLYLALSLANDPRAFLGTDTGGKVATLRAMEARGDLDPDLGYWAQRYDSEGAAHPIALNSRIGDRWVNVTTLPMVYAAVPLYELGGLRAILLLPMLGGVLSALAARALARRLATRERDRAGWAAFWAVGVATPVVVYALDFWEHTLGLAAMLWGVVALLDVAERGSRWPTAALGGFAFGVAATMRTEALVYAAVTFAVVGMTVLVGRRRDVVRLAAAAAVGFVVPIGVNHVIERAVLGQGLRASRASGAVSDGAGDVTDRAADAFRTTVGLNHFGPPAVDWLIGALIVGCVALVMVVLLRGSRSALLAWVALTAAVLLYVVRFADGLGFVPGMLVASPLAVAGLVGGWSTSSTRRVAVIAVGALPVVWLYQYRGGANPQWGGRYVLLSGVLLAVLGTVALVRRGRTALVPALVAALLVTACGVAWLGVRSNAIARSAEVLETRDPVVSIGLPHQLREWGAFYGPDRRWLTAEHDGELPSALAVLEAAGARRMTVLARVPGEAPRRLGSFVRVDRGAFGLVPGVDLVVARYRRA